LHRDIERAGRLIGDDQLWLQGESDGNQHALLHPARELMRILMQALLRMAQPNFLQQLQHALLARGPAKLLMQLQDLANLIANGLHRIKRITGILRHQADMHAAHAVHAPG